jgi:hypothetical protein
MTRQVRRGWPGGSSRQAGAQRGSGVVKPDGRSATEQLQAHRAVHAVDELGGACWKRNGLGCDRRQKQACGQQRPQNHRAAARQ